MDFSESVLVPFISKCYGLNVISARIQYKPN